MTMKTNPNYDQYIPTRILFGAGQLNNLHAHPMPGKRALIVISNGTSTRANGYLARTEEQLHRAGVATEVFDGITPDEFDTFMRNTREVMGIMFTADRVRMSDDDIVRIFAESYK